MLIDIGNSRVKFTANKAPFLVAAITHNDTEKLYEQLKSDKPHRVLVTHGRSQSARDIFFQLNSLCQQHSIVLSTVTVHSEFLKVNYTDTQQFGVDRYLNLLAAASRYQQNFCVVSCGTALTLDFFTDEHIGGMILPGLGISQQLLVDKTGLKDISKPEALLGNDTASSIGSGIYIGLQNLIYRSIERIEAQQQQKFTVILTGGDAQALYEHGSINENLLFEGMQCYSKKTKKLHDDNSSTNT